MAYHNGQEFSTYDRDNDAAIYTHCAQWLGGGFWFNACVYADITVSPANNNFRWYDPPYDLTYYIQLNVVLVDMLSLIC